MKILVPVDGSELALDALHHALALVREGLFAEFVLANVQEPATFYEILTTRDPQAVEEAGAEAGRHLIEPAAALCREAGVAFDSEVAFGDPVNTLNEIVERYQCDAIVMGARGRGTVTGALLGSVSQRMTHDAAVPVTIVKHPQPSESTAAEFARDDEVEDERRRGTDAGPAA